LEGMELLRIEFGGFPGPFILFDPIPFWLLGQSAISNIRVI